MISNEDILILSDGKPSRTFCYVSDAITGYLKVLLYGQFDVFNIGSDKPELSISNLAEIYKQKAKKLLNYDIKIRYEKPEEKNYLTDNPNRRCPIIEKARKALNYTPKISVEEGVERFIKYTIEKKGAKND